MDRLITWLTRSPHPRSRKTNTSVRELNLQPRQHNRSFQTNHSCVRPPAPTVWTWEHPLGATRENSLLRCFVRTDRGIHVPATRITQPPKPPNHLLYIEGPRFEVSVSHDTAHRSVNQCGFPASTRGTPPRHNDWFNTRTGSHSLSATHDTGYPSLSGALRVRELRLGGSVSSVSLPLSTEETDGVLSFNKDEISGRRISRTLTSRTSTSSTID